MGLGDLFDDLSGFFGQKIAPNPLKMGVFGYLVLNRHLLSFYCHFWCLEAIEKSPIFAASKSKIKDYGKESLSDSKHSIMGGCYGMQLDEKGIRI